jgi:hypothetical protein
MAANLPTINIAEEARTFVTDAYLDGDRYANYLVSRHVPEEDIEKLDLVIDEGHMFLGSHALFKPRGTDDRERHLIAFSPERMPRTLEGQGRTLRHESEHLVQQIKNPNRVRNRLRYMSAFGISGGIATGTSVYLGTEAYTGDLPVGLKVPINLIPAIGLAGVGAVLSIGATIVSMPFISPSEIGARWAQRRRVHELPDGILQIQFASSA